MDICLTRNEELALYEMLGNLRDDDQDMVRQYVEEDPMAFFEFVNAAYESVVSAYIEDNRGDFDEFAGNGGNG